MKCPNCEETLVMTERQGVEIDYCPKCRGVWLDKGELDKIIDRSQEETRSDHPDNRNFDNRFDDDDDDENFRRGNKGRGGRGGFLSNLFDFD
ncbi:MAG TPA: zf-TFIIB domain-containing protein [Chitinophagaceae bacterium]